MGNGCLLISFMYEHICRTGEPFPTSRQGVTVSTHLVYETITDCVAATGAGNDDLSASQIRFGALDL